MQLARMLMINPTSDKLLAYVRYKEILQTQSNSGLAQSITDLRATRYQSTSKVGQILLINKKQSEKMLTRNQDNWGP